MIYGVLSFVSVVLLLVLIAVDILSLAIGQPPWRK